ncbi:uncharacterized protein N7496_000530 [Penicillium cataractarum]|uniref:Uncharacterized protein n=1 Tax=Penicillium cataractarum TaxID=2100454 RepID=A0A9W9VU75_9EURO|nr:uncharacterized protein N7496_000530 [Penicillium cataractarum]KAJ5389462.1 hypothetical protein N7496_000530 [Penicillium cataractarum]
MALRQPPNPKHTTDRHETDYERWLKDHDDHYQPEGKPQYHPSDVESTTQNGDDDEIDDTTPGEEDTTTKTKAKTKINVSHGYAENVHVDDDGAVVRVSRYGSIMYPSKHDAVSMGAANHLGTGAGVSMDHTFLRVEQRESMDWGGVLGGIDNNGRGTSGGSISMGYLLIGKDFMETV